MSKFSIQAYQDKREIEWDAATDQERTVLRRRITATDREIDQLVYALYDLTENEIAIVEQSTTQKTNAIPYALQ